MADRAGMLSLYRSLLRLHSKCGLPADMKELGNSYVKSEFRQHRKMTDANEIQQFGKEWQLYIQQMKNQSQSQENQKSYGRNLSSELHFSDEQQDQLNKLKEEARNIATSSTDTDTK